MLVGLSGGPDSQALLYSLLKTDLDIGIAHVDHGWRKESKQEAEILKEQATKLNLPFYLKQLNPEEMRGNLEQSCREKRYAFFTEICRTQGYEAVALGHHRDDNAETILKRLLEGASLQAMSGMEKESYWDHLLVVRPILEVPKEILLQFCEEEKIPYFIDTTNRDERFLRARMRENILPDLSAQFGKSVKEPLIRFGKECRELNAFMRGRFNGILSRREMDLCSMESPFEVRWVLKEWLRNFKLSVSHSVIDAIVQWILTRAANKSIPLKEDVLEVDRGRIFIRKKKSPSWKVKEELQLDQEVLGWEEAWKGRLEMWLPEGSFSLVPYYDLEKEERKRLQKLWTAAKVPAFFREWVPVIRVEGKYFGEFLSGQRKSISHPLKKVILYLE